MSLKTSLGMKFGRSMSVGNTDMFDMFLCAASSGGSWSRRSPDTYALRSAMSSPICQHTLAPAVNSYQQ